MRRSPKRETSFVRRHIVLSLVALFLLFTLLIVASVLLSPEPKRDLVPSQKTIGQIIDNAADLQLRQPAPATGHAPMPQPESTAPGDAAPELKRIYTEILGVPLRSELLPRQMRSLDWTQAYPAEEQYLDQLQSQLDELYTSLSAANRLFMTTSQSYTINIPIFLNDLDDILHADALRLMQDDQPEAAFRRIVTLHKIFSLLDSPDASLWYADEKANRDMQATPLLSRFVERYPEPEHLKELIEEFKPVSPDAITLGSEIRTNYAMYFRQPQRSPRPELIILFDNLQDKIGGLFDSKETKDYRRRLEQEYDFLLPLADQPAYRIMATPGFIEMNSSLGWEVENTARSGTAHNAMILKAAVLQYRNLHGSFPATLDALVPEILPTMPLDCLSNMPFEYRKTNNGFIITPAYRQGTNMNLPMQDSALLKRYQERGMIFPYPLYEQGG